MGDILPLIFTLFAVIIILYLSYLFTKFIGKRTISARSNGNMKVVDKLAITQDKSVVVIKVDNKYYLLAVSQSDVKLIAELDSFDESNLTPAGSNYENVDFKNIITQLLPKPKK